MNDNQKEQQAIDLHFFDSSGLTGFRYQNSLVHFLVLVFLVVSAVWNLSKSLADASQHLRHKF